MSKIVEFLKDVKIELSRVSWPTRKQTFEYTLAVVLTSILVALFLSGWDTIFGFILNKVITK